MVASHPRKTIAKLRLTLPPGAHAGCGRFSVAEAAWIGEGRRKGVFRHIERSAA
jgi:hypothetical protein